MADPQAQAEEVVARSRGTTCAGKYKPLTLMPALLNTSYCMSYGAGIMYKKYMY